MDKRMRLEDKCREALKVAYSMMTEYGWSQFKAYAYAKDLLQGMSFTLSALMLYNELNLVEYYKNIAYKKMLEA